MRVALAIAASLMILAGLAAPHHHEGQLGSHACPACVVGGADEARDETPRVERLDLRPELAAVAPGLPPVTGASLGAIPGQSPPPA